MKQTRGTAQWAYRFGADEHEVSALLELLTTSGLLLRSVHKADGHKIANITNVEIGDTVHVYVLAEGLEQYRSSFLIERPTDPVDPDARAIEAVRDGPLFEQLTEAGYPVDPVLECFTGFRVRKDDYATPPVARPRWVAKNAIARIAPITRPAAPA